MFDTFFPVALFCGPLALVILLRLEARRTTASFWPQIATIALALPAVWGISYWVLMFAIILFGEGMNQQSFFGTTIISVTTAVLIVIAGYCRLVVRRRLRSSSSD